jgi:hypothetical protein
LEEALELSVTTENTYNLILVVNAFAQLALSTGDGARAALLAGAASGLRRRAGLQVFSSLTGEVDLVAQIRTVMDADSFDQAYAAGSKLGRLEAVAAVREPCGAGAHA